MLFAWKNGTKNRVWGWVLLAALSILAARGSTVLGGSATSAGSFSVFGSGFSMVGTGGSCGFSCSFVLSEGPGVYSFSNGLSSEYGSGIAGSYTLEGQQYSYSCTVGTSCGVGLDFSGTFTWPGGLPPFSAVTVTTPFTAQGGIGLVMISPGVFAPPLYFSGGGIASIRIVQFEAGSRPEFRGGDYTFVATPEPSAIGLMVFGLVAMAIGCWRPRRSAYTLAHPDPAAQPHVSAPKRLHLGWIAQFVLCTPRAS